MSSLVNARGIPHVMKVYDKNTNCRGNQKKSGESPQGFRSNLPVQWLREKHKRQERQRKNHGIMVWLPSLRRNDDLRKNKDANQKEKQPVPPVLAPFNVLHQ
jgi:hypothetical protein